MSDKYGIIGLPISGEVRVRWLAPDENICRFGRIEFYLPDMQLFDIPLAEIDSLVTVLRLLQRNAMDTELRLKGMDGRDGIQHLPEG